MVFGDMGCCLLLKITFTHTIGMIWKGKALELKLDIGSIG